MALAVNLRQGKKSVDACVARIGGLLSMRPIRCAETLGLGLWLAYRISAKTPNFWDRPG
jgi:hypothetical protein